MSGHYTPTDVAVRFNVSPRTVQRWCRTRAIGHIRTPGGAYRFTDEQLTEFERVYSRAPAKLVNVSQPNPSYVPRGDVVVAMRRPA